MFRYCIFGDTVSIATQLALNVSAGRILVSKQARQCAQRTGRFEFEDFNKDEALPVEAAFYLKRSFKKSVWEIINRERGFLLSFLYMYAIFLDENINSIDGYTELNEILQTDKQAKNGNRMKNVKICSIL